MFPIRELLSQHEKFADRTTLPGNLGDGFLYSQNPLFRRVRDLASKLGYTYTHVDFCNYVALPLGALPEILKQKKIPFVENVCALRDLERERPGLFHIEELSRFKANVVLHESCHAIADAMIPKQRALSPFEVMFCEGFALGCEAAGNIFIDSDVHRRFYELNCYGDCFLEEAASKLMRKSALKLGLACTLQLIHLSYLSALYCSESFNTKRTTRVLRLISISSNESLELAQSVLNIGTRLNVGFVMKTSSFYMKLIGLEHEFESTQGIDFLEVIENNALYQSSLSELGKIIAEGAKGEEGPKCSDFSRASQLLS